MDILEKLLADHARLRQALALLKHDLTVGDADELQEMYDIVTDYAEYYSNVHCPLEACVFRYMCRQEADRRPLVEQALTEHEQLKQQADLFQSLLDEALHGGIMLREDLVHLGWQFYDTSLDNMAREEQMVFVWLREELTEEDWTVIYSQAGTLGQSTQP